MYPMLLLLATFAAEPVIQHSEKAVTVTGLDSTTLKTPEIACKVVVAGDNAEETAQRPAILGTYETKDGTLTFTPRFPFAAGTSYRVTVMVPGQKAVHKDFAIPRPDAPPAEITLITPSGDKVPENVLRFYVHFSIPMERGTFSKHISLKRADGVVVDSPFLELDEELWSPDGLRLTLLVDPGRIKQGVKPREDLGAVFDAGQSYTLSFDNAWKDANGRNLKAKVNKSLKAVAADNLALDITQWKIAPPKAETKNAVIITLPKALDAALLKRMVWLTNAKGEKTTGDITLDKHETVWVFTPENAWAEGKYRLMADTRLEDVCGNRIGSPFEIDVFNPVTKRLDLKTVAVDFTIAK